MKIVNDNTLLFYEQTGDRYFADTCNIDISEIYLRFVKYLPQGARILDAGSGSGRDTTWFLQNGYTVDSFDGSRRMAKISTRHTGQVTNVLTFSEYLPKSLYNGIWACASLLHLPIEEIKETIKKFEGSLFDNGIIYASFKHGDSERTDLKGRYFTDINENRIDELILNTNLKVVDKWISLTKYKVSKSKCHWQNMILQRC